MVWRRSRTGSKMRWECVGMGIRIKHVDALKWTEGGSCQVAQDKNGKVNWGW